MNRKYKKIISTFLVTIFTVTTLFGSQYQNVYAQGTGTTGSTFGTGSTYGAGSGVGFGSGGGNIQGLIKDLLPAIAKLPGCKSKLKKGATFSTISSASTGANTDNIWAGPDGASDITGEQSLPTSQSGAQGQVDAIEVVPTAAWQKQFDNITQQVTDTKKSVTSIDTNETCLNSIGKMVVKVMVQKLTVSTVEWINNGFEGNPSFIQAPIDAYENIKAKNILEIGAQLNDPNKYPFAKTFLRNEANNFRSHFANNAAYSLNQVVSPDREGFENDFGNGGWDAWEIMTQIPANNPLGFQLLASEELQNQTRMAQQNLQNDLLQGSGFMSQEVCVDPKGVTHDEDARYLNGEFTDENGKREDPATSEHHCRKWKHVTPGSLIADAAIDTQKYPKDSLLTADTLNDAIAAIADALANQLATKLQNGVDGYLGLSATSGNGAGPYSSGLDNYASLTDRTRTEMDFPNSLSSSWLQHNPNFDIRTDLTQALIDEQRTYIEKLTAQNRELYSTIKTSAEATALGLPATYRGNYGLIPIIYQLDFCIPGPHPGWEEVADQNFEMVLNNGVKDITGLDWLQLGVFLGDDASEVANAAYGVLSGFDMSGTLTPESVDLIYSAGNGGVTYTVEQARVYYDKVITEITGLDASRDMQIQTYEKVINIITTAYAGYKKVIENVFNLSVMPSVTREANTEFEKAEGYTQMQKNNTDKISVQKGIVIRLAAIKNAVDALNDKLTNHTFVIASPNTTEQEQYEYELKPWINAFGRISRELVDGDDIARADIISQQIKDKEKYIYNDLLKGSTGCERELSAPTTAANPYKLPWPVTNGTRYNYPLPHLYNYNTIVHGAALPDPLGAHFGHAPFINTQAYGMSDNNGAGTSELTWATFNGFPTGPNAVILCGYVSQYPDTFTNPPANSCSNGTSGPTIIHITHLLNPDNLAFRGNTLGIFERYFGMY